MKFTIDDVPYLYDCEFKYNYTNYLSETIYKLKKLDNNRFTIIWDNMIYSESQLFKDAKSCLNKGLWVLTNNSKRLIKIKKLKANG